MSSYSKQFYSGIRTHIKHTVLRRGSILAACGIALWVICGTLLSLSTLSTWGPWIFLCGGALIAFGMVPYRRLTHLEDRPHRLIIEGDALHFLHKGKELFSIPLLSIKKMEYREDKALYGIALWLQSGEASSHIHVYHKRVHANHYVAKVQRRYGCDLFFPYFAKSVYDELVSMSMQENGTNVGDEGTSKLPISS